MVRLVRRVIARALIGVGLILLASCRSWQPVANPEPLIEADEAQRVRVVLHDGRRAVLSHPRVTPDSIIGFTNIRLGTLAAFPVNSIARVEESRFSLARTVLLAIALPPAVFSGLWVAYILSG